MGFTIERDSGILIVKAEGRLDGTNAQEFQSGLSEQIGDDDRAVILDLEQLSYISSAGLRVILLTAKALQRQDAALAVCSLSEPIREVFAISGFDKIITVRDSQAEAISALNG